MILVPLSLADANALVAAWHRHSKPVRGHRFSIGAHDGDHLVEVLRLVTDGTPNACSFLYGASARAARALGYRLAITYTLATEPGTSLKAAGWRLEAVVHGRSWLAAGDERQQGSLLEHIDVTPLGDKVRWSCDLVRRSR